MPTVIAVEPNALLRMGILRLLEKTTFNIASEGIDYSQLFKGAPPHEGVDLMLLSVPNVYDRVAQLVAAAQREYRPKRILLLSSVRELTYSLLNLPPTVAGYISKYSSAEALSAAIMLVLAGGTCFPAQGSSDRGGDQAGGQNPSDANTAPQRRWYDKPPPPPAAAPAKDVQPANLLAPASPQSHMLRLAASNTPAISIKGDAHPLSPALIAHETEMLGLTPRQFEVLALLARGYSIKNISRELGISIATTKVHAQTLYQRLAVHNRNAAIHTAFSLGATLGWSRLDIARGEVAKF